MVLCLVIAKQCFKPLWKFRTRSSTWTASVYTQQCTNKVDTSCILAPAGLGCIWIYIYIFTYFLIRSAIASFCLKLLFVGSSLHKRKDQSCLYIIVPAGPLKLLILCPDNRIKCWTVWREPLLEAVLINWKLFLPGSVYLISYTGNNKQLVAWSTRHFTCICEGGLRGDVEGG